MKYKIRIQNQVYEVSEILYKKIKDLKHKNTGEVKLNGKTFKLSEIEILSNPMDEYIDWSAIESKNIDEESKTSLKTQNIIKNDIKKLLKERNKDWQVIVKDEIHRTAIDDVWGHLKASINDLKYPTIDSSYKDDLSITTHNQGRESHPVAYKSKEIDLGDKYDSNFWAEANYIFCNTCNKFIRKQILIFNNYDDECIVRDLV